MAKMSVQVQNRDANAAYVTSSMSENRDLVVQGLLAHNAYLPAARQIDEATVRVFLDWVAGTIEYKTKAMIAAEDDYVKEQSDDPPVRERRDAAMPVLLPCMIQTRTRVSSVLGETGLAAYGMSEPPPRQPVELAAYAGTVLKLMRAQPRSQPDRVGGTFDTAVLATAIDDALAPLQDALRELVTEQRQLQTAMIRRDTEATEWRDVYVNGATAFAALARMAGHPEIAQRVRPSSRRASGRAAGPGDDISPDLPENDEGSDGDAPIVTPEPIVIAPGK
jgi:hypothetical protein